MDKIYAAIDLKSFYASVECVERGLDPLTTNLVVADKSRTEKTICLAVSPSLKNQIPLTSIFLLSVLCFLYQPIFYLDPLQFFQKRAAKQPQEDHGGGCMYQIHRHT